MGTLPLTAEQRPGTDLVSAYVTYIGDHEPVNLAAIRDADASHPCDASLLIGAGCLFLVHGDDRMADQTLRGVRDAMHTYTSNKWHRTGPYGANAAHMLHIATMILDRDDPGAAQAFQAATHAEAIRDLRILGPRLRDPVHAGTVSGDITQQGVNSLATRYAGAGTLAIQALWHHDQGPVAADNYDLLVIDCGSGPTPQATAHRAQLKHHCLGFCGDQRWKRLGQRERDHYMQDIVLVSEHCDITKPMADDMGDLTKKLLREARNQATEIEKATLDMGTLGLLQTIVEPEAWRMGKLPIKRTVPYRRRQAA